MPPETTAITVHTLPEALTLSAELAKARPVLPKHCQDAGTVLAIVLAGAELGLPPMLAMRSIHLVEGRPVIAAEMQLAIAARSGVRWRWVRSDAQIAKLALTRPSWPDHEHEYTMDMAKRAGLAGKQNWRGHPEAMLRARCVSAAVRAYCPDVLSGVLDPDEAAEITTAASGARETGRAGTSAGLPTVDAEIVEETSPVVHDPERIRLLVELRELAAREGGDTPSRVDAALQVGVRDVPWLQAAIAKISARLAARPVTPSATERPPSAPAAGARDPVPVFQRGAGSAEQIAHEEAAQAASVTAQAAIDAAAVLEGIPPGHRVAISDAQTALKRALHIERLNGKRWTTCVEYGARLDFWQVEDGCLVRPLPRVTDADIAAAEREIDPERVGMIFSEVRGMPADLADASDDQRREYLERLLDAASV